MRRVQLVYAGLADDERLALEQAATQHPALSLRSLLADHAAGDADLLLLAGNAFDGAAALPALPAIALALSAERMTEVAARHPLVYSSRTRPAPGELISFLQRLLADWQGSDGLVLGAPALAPETLAELQEQRNGLSRALCAAGAISVQLHLAEQRMAPILVLGPAADDCVANTHAEGVGAIALRGGADVAVDAPTTDARARAGLDYPESSAELPMIVLALGSRHLAGQDWAVALTLRALGRAQLQQLVPLARALVDALWPQVEVARGTPLALRRLYRPAALAALQQGDRELAWPAFAPAWARRYTRLWRWPLLLAPLLLWLPVAPGVSGSAQLIYADAPPVVSPLQASVVALVVKPGDAVQAGDVLLRLRDPAAELQLDQAWSDYRALLRQSLRTPQDQTLALALAQHWERVLSALSRRELALLAPVDGRVIELPASIGASVADGALLALVQPDAGRAMLELQIPLQGMAPVTVGTRGWLRRADGSERRLRVASLGAIIRDTASGAGAPTQRSALAELIDTTPALLPGERGTVHLDLPAQPLYRHLWYALGGARR